MGETISNKLQSLLDEYCCSVSGVLGLGISTSDGLEISSHFNKIVDTMTAHAVSSSIYNQSQFSARKLGFDTFG